MWNHDVSLHFPTIWWHFSKNSKNLITFLQKLEKFDEIAKKLKFVEIWIGQYAISNEIFRMHKWNKILSNEPYSICLNNKSLIWWSRFSIWQSIPAGIKAECYCQIVHLSRRLYWVNTFWWVWNFQLTACTRVSNGSNSNKRERKKKQPKSAISIREFSQSSVAKFTYFNGKSMIWYVTNRGKCIFSMIFHGKSMEFLKYSGIIFFYIFLRLCLTYKCTFLVFKWANLSMSFLRFFFTIIVYFSRKFIITI